MMQNSKRALALCLIVLVYSTFAFQSRPSYHFSQSNVKNDVFPYNIAHVGIKGSSCRSSIVKDRTRLYKGMWSQDEELVGSDRLKACVPYILPLLDGDRFGHFIYQRIPPLGFLNDLLLGPLVEIYHHIPFLGVGIFILLTLGTRFNTNMNRNVRFSAQQAALIDVALILPELVSSGFDGVAVPRYIAEPCSNFVWYAYMTAVVYSIYCNLRGKKPDQIPYISGSADMMVGPY